MHILSNKRLESIVADAVKSGVEQYGAESVQREAKILEQQMKLRADCVPHDFQRFTNTHERLERNYGPNCQDVVQKMQDTQEVLVCTKCGEVVKPFQNLE